MKSQHNFYNTALLAIDKLYKEKFLRMVEKCKEYDFRHQVYPERK